MGTNAVKNQPHCNRDWKAILLQSWDSFSSLLSFCWMKAKYHLWWNVPCPSWLVIHCTCMCCFVPPCYICWLVETRVSSSYSGGSAVTGLCLSLSSFVLLQTILPYRQLTCWVPTEYACTPGLPGRALLCLSAGSRLLVYLASSGSKKECAWKWSLAGDFTVVGINAAGSTLPKGCSLAHLLCSAVSWR